MSRGDAYVREIQNYTQEIVRLKTERDKLIAKRKLAERHLYDFMVQMGVDRVGTVTKKSVTPKQPTHRKKLSDKKRDAIKLFYQIGAPDPEELYERFRQTQKIIE